MKTRTRMCKAAAVSYAALWSTLSFAGPITPPPGPVAATHKTLSEVEPRVAINATNTPGDADSLFKITQPGSYYLTGNITGVVGKHGVEIAAPGVTLDLNGFDLVGVPGMGAFDGVNASGVTNSVAVVNGSVREWGDDGVDLQFTDSNCLVQHVRVSRNQGDGIVVSQSSRGGSVVSHCSTYFNTGDGIVAGFGCTISYCTARYNTGTGIKVYNGSTVSFCAANDNSGFGIDASTNAAILGCAAYDNTQHGIVAGEGSNITDCTAGRNGRDGIRFSSACVIRGNSCSYNSYSNIHATLSDNRIQGNNCVEGGWGIDVDSGGNIIIQNTCAGNSINYEIAANNRYGAIVNITATGTAAVSGSSAASTLSSTDPHANFAY